MCCRVEPVIPCGSLHCMPCTQTRLRPYVAGRYWTYWSYEYREKYTVRVDFIWTQYMTLIRHVVLPMNTVTM